MAKKKDFAVETLDREIERMLAGVFPAPLLDAEDDEEVCADCGGNCGCARQPWRAALTFGDEDVATTAKRLAVKK